MRPRGLLLLLWCLATSVASSMEISLDRRSIEEAIGIGQSSIERDRTRFHEPYRFVVSRAPVDYIDIVTPFRRVELAAEMRARIGDRRFGQADALKLLDAASMLLSVHVELTFHPMNTYIGVPDYGIKFMSTNGAVIEPLKIDRVPRFGPRVEGMPMPFPSSTLPPSLPGRSLPMLGGTAIAEFDGRSFMPSGSYKLAVSEGDRELARIDVDLGRLR